MSIKGVLAGATILLLVTESAVHLLKLLLGTPLFLAVPVGCMLLLGRLSGHDEVTPRALAVAVICAFAFYPLVLLALYGFGGPIHATETAWAVEILALVTAVVEKIRSTRSRGVIRESGTATPGHHFFATYWTAWLAAIVGLSLVAVAGLLKALPPPAGPGYTQLWLSGTSSQVLLANRSVAFGIHVRNANQGQQRFVLSLSIPGDNQKTSTVLVLKPGEVWSGALALTYPAGGCRFEVAAILESPGGGGSVAEVSDWVTEPKGCNGY